ncbi:2-C-methyl-D-erythritol 4-phosphate cytidylyltransferase [Pseudalkalibacillus salsuginis]|uniref:2-C-methyl-D-erythritol 4-phosphate cytidylyltransferase n=1 Tax=Pseudalkalibacillus salsuginis TaxID=2910972 RepID=UPI001F35D650|nr:2-C-methyl-D-erythritol 4-phosphate cytidylyltransferase [Pseudalkalibacillus salsuginis]MCF6411880.1 2-C-methyl-D-erythritol 4-phosphate cytidylyltransferase [Pseudalkalibacillus salsuginis]
MDYIVVIPAAGQGKRMDAGKNKQLITLQGIPLIVHTLRIFQEDDWCSGIILVGNKRELNELEQIVSEYNLDKVQRIVAGGLERQHSVYEGLKAIDAESLVLIHDGARPFVSIDSIHNLVTRTIDSGAAVLAVPIKDTVKRIERGTVIETVDRSSLWAIQTPQAFHLSLIRDAHEAAGNKGHLGTDDASLVEHFGSSVSIVEGDYLNIKLTTKEDLLFANAIIREREEQRNNV